MATEKQLDWKHEEKNENRSESSVFSKTGSIYIISALTKRGKGS